MLSGQIRDKSAYEAEMIDRLRNMSNPSLSMMDQHKGWASGCENEALIPSSRDPPIESQIVKPTPKTRRLISYSGDFQGDNVRGPVEAFKQFVGSQIIKPIPKVRRSVSVGVTICEQNILYNPGCFISNQPGNPCEGENEMLQGIIMEYNPEESQIKMANSRVQKSVDNLDNLQGVVGDMTGLAEAPKEAAKVNIYLKIF